MEPDQILVTAKRKRVEELPLFQDNPNPA